MKVKGYLLSYYTELLSNQGEKGKLLFDNGSFKKKVLKYGTPKPSIRFIRGALLWGHYNRDPMI